MAKHLVVNKPCTRCRGSGVADTPIASQREDPCTQCGGKGAMKLAGLEYGCETCNATGTVIVDGVSTECPDCSGKGHILVAFEDFDIAVLVTKVDDLADAVNDVMNKCLDILEKLNE